MNQFTKILIGLLPGLVQLKTLTIYQRLLRLEKREIEMHLNET